MFSSKGRALRFTNNAAVTIREIEYSIRITDKNSSFIEILGILKDELTQFRNHTGNIRPGSNNTIYDFIKNNIDRSIIIRENTRVYFLDYKETEGSLRIGFTLLVITDYIKFASLRQLVDSIVKDNIVDYFEELLERHIPVSITVQATDTEIITLDNPSLESTRPRRNWRDIVTRSIAILAFIFSLLLASVFVYFNTNLRTENDKLKEDYIDMVLEKKIMEAVKDQKFTIKLYKIADTLGSSSNKPADPRAK